MLGASTITAVLWSGQSFPGCVKIILTQKKWFIFGRGTIKLYVGQNVLLNKWSPFHLDPWSIVTLHWHFTQIYTVLILFWHYLSTKIATIIYNESIYTASTAWPCMHGDPPKCDSILLCCIRSQPTEITLQ